MMVKITNLLYNLVAKNFFKGIVLFSCIGIWCIVLQNAGILHTKQYVYVKGGNLSTETEIIGRVNIKGKVAVSNTVDINISEINGNPNVFYDFGGNEEYVRLPVMTGYPTNY